MEKIPLFDKTDINITVKKNRNIAEFIFLLILTIVPLLFLYSIVHSAISVKENAIDTLAFRYFRPLISDSHTRIANIITFFGTGTFLIPAYILILIYLIRCNCHKYALMVLTMVITSLLLGWILKPTFHRMRPPFPLVTGAGGYSFPSGHALGGFIFTGVIIYLIWKTGKKIHIKCIMSIFFAAFGVLIGLSRVYLHVHYATDVAGSLLVALTWLSMTYLCFRIIYKDSLHETIGQSFSDPDIPAVNFHFLNQSE